MQPFTQRVIDVIRSIPPGKVMTYGQIARIAGSSRGARQVVRILHSMSRAHRLPWHRVVSSNGAVRVPDDDSKMVQLLMLQSEGVEILHHHVVDLERYLYHPMSDERATE